MKKGTDRLEIPAPLLNPDEQAGMRDFLECYERHFKALNDALLGGLQRLPDLYALFKQMSPAQLEEQNRVSQELMRKAILQGDWAPLISNQHSQGELYAGLGVRFKEWF